MSDEHDDILGDDFIAKKKTDEVDEYGEPFLDEDLNPEGLDELLFPGGEDDSF